MVKLFRTATEYERQHPQAELLRDLREGFKLNRHHRTTTQLPGHADPFRIETTTKKHITTTKTGWFDWFG